MKATIQSRECLVVEGGVRCGKPTWKHDMCLHHTYQAIRKRRFPKTPKPEPRHA